MDLSKRFSLDYLISGSANQRSGSGGSSVSQLQTIALEEAIQAFVSPVLRALDALPEGRGRVFTLYDSVRDSLPGTEIDTFRDVIKWMAKTNLVTMVESDPHGNDLIRKT